MHQTTRRGINYVIAPCHCAMTALPWDGAQTNKGICEKTVSKGHGYIEVPLANTRELANREHLTFNQLLTTKERN